MDTKHRNPFKNTSRASATQKYKYQNINKKINIQNKNSLLTRKEKFDPEKAIENSTPWHQLKEGLLEASECKNKHKIFPDGQQEVEKVRQQNYKKFLMKEKQKEPVQWERFSPEPEPSSNSKSKLSKKKTKNSEMESLNERIKLNKQRFVKNRVLTPKENDYMRRVITKTAFMSKGLTVENAIYSMKNRGVVLKNHTVQPISEQKSKKNKKSKKSS